MATHGSFHGLTFPALSLSLSPSLSKQTAATMSMSPGGGSASGGRSKGPPPQGVHPRYVPKRGSVLKGIVRGVLRCFVCASTANTGGRRVRPAEAGGDAPEQGK
ncbi:hypothetical protein HU200_004074 [Digitaria exilis]|uniref:Uncharacterized protein n=1 Tax=Digitaria exilis TaxID=1010633 RepID=A0A835KVB9_9POAL|nr:hypothetical protein HU200_004117 [Digitaria exilis]KAF8775939.1 hypothetical protein HU200_004074 [Digitaria exilis]